MNNKGDNIVISALLEDESTRYFKVPQEFDKSFLRKMFIVDVKVEVLDKNDTAGRISVLWEKEQGVDLLFNKGTLEGIQYSSRSREYRWGYIMLRYYCKHRRKKCNKVYIEITLGEEEKKKWRMWK